MLTFPDCTVSESFSEGVRNLSNDVVLRQKLSARIGSDNVQAVCDIFQAHSENQQVNTVTAPPSFQRRTESGDETSTVKLTLLNGDKSERSRTASRRIRGCDSTAAIDQSFPYTVPRLDQPLEASRPDQAPPDSGIWTEMSSLDQLLNSDDPTNQSHGFLLEAPNNGPPTDTNFHNRANTYEPLTNSEESSQILTSVQFDWGAEFDLRVAGDTNEEE